MDGQGRSGDGVPPQGYAPQQGYMPQQGYLPREVYLRRRIVFFGGVVLFGFVLYFLIKAATAGDDAAGPAASPDPSATGTPSTAPPALASELPTCGLAELSIDLSPVTRNYAGFAAPSFEATVTHTGLAACALDTSPAKVELLITSGSDRIWSSADCDATAVASARTTLEPDAASVLTLDWPRIRSNPSCATGLSGPRPGTYHAVVTIDGAVSSDATFTLSD